MFRTARKKLAGKGELASIREGFIMRVRAPVLMIVAAMIAGPARAEFITGNQLCLLYTSDAADE